MNRSLIQKMKLHKRWDIVSHLIWFLFFVCMAVHAQSPPASYPTTHKVFGLDESFDHPVHLPDSVLKALIATKEARYVRDELKENPRLDVSQFFLAKEVHLSESKEIDYVVFGQFPLTGADCNWFWIVRSIEPRPRVVLFSIGTTLEILDRKKNEEQPDIRMDWWAGSGYGWADEYRFNGSRYVRFRRLNTYWEFKEETATSPASWVMLKSPPFQNAATQ